MRNGSNYVRCTRTDSFWHFRETSHTQKWETLPSSARPANVVSTRPLIWLLEYVAEVQVPPQATTPSLFSQYVSNLQSWEAELLQHLEFSNDPFTASHAIMHQGFRAVSDGSVWDDNQGAFGWTLSTVDGIRIAQGMGPARGAKVDSYRAESYGMLAILCFLNRLAIFTDQHIWVSWRRIAKVYWKPSR